MVERACFRMQWVVECRLENENENETKKEEAAYGHTCGYGHPLDREINDEVHHSAFIHRSLLCTLTIAPTQFLVLCSVLIGSGHLFYNRGVGRPSLNEPRAHLSARRSEFMSSVSYLASGCVVSVKGKSLKVGRRRHFHLSRG